jgi:uncharacterized protein
MAPWFFDQVPAGQRVTKEWPIVQMADGSNVNLRSVIFRGIHDGPTLYIGAAIHGDEICGIEVMRQVLCAIEREELHGALVLLPVQNPWAFYERQRFLPAHSFDVFNIDVFNVFPGSPHGEISQVLAYGIMEGFVRHCDYAVDLHAAMQGGRNLDYCFTPGGSDPKVAEARKLARAFLLPMVMEQDEPGGYVGPTKYQQVITLAGTPTFCVELQEAGEVTHQSLQKGLAGFLNIMRLLEMLRDQPYRTPENQFIAHGSVYARVERGGMYIPEITLGNIVEKGDRLGTLYGLDFTWEEPVLSPVEGLLYRSAKPHPIHSSERVASIATK